MPVSVATVLKPPSETAFRDLDYQIMREAFSIHNQYGHLMDEACYRRALSNRCSEIDFERQEEVAIDITHGNFRKIYYIDLLVQRSFILELKTVEQLHPRHDSQLLNYLLLCEMPYGKLINFGRPSVESRFVSTSLKRPDRSSFSIRTNGWQPQSDACTLFITGISSSLTNHLPHLKRIAENSSLRHIQWINLYRSQITLTTVTS